MGIPPAECLGEGQLWSCAQLPPPPWGSELGVLEFRQSRHPLPQEWGPPLLSNSACFQPSAEGCLVYGGHHPANGAVPAHHDDPGVMRLVGVQELRQALEVPGLPTHLQHL